jgi:hypothetical protein
MQCLPNDLIIVICDYILKITDKRKFTQTCKIFNNVTKGLILIAELNLKEYPVYSHFDRKPEKFKIEHFKYNNEYSVEKFTLELCHDEYFNLIPKSYISSNNSIICKALAIYGQLELLKKAIKYGCEPDREKDHRFTNDLFNICNHAVISGNVDMVKYLLLEDWCITDSLTCKLASKYGYLHILTFLKEYGSKFDYNSPNYAAYNGDIKTLKWLINNDCPIDHEICDYAVMNGHVYIIKWLMRKHGYEPTSESCEIAIENNNLDLLKWLIKHKCSLDIYRCYHSAAIKNYLHIIKYLEQNYEVSSGACKGAAETGNIDLLISLRQKGYPLDEKVFMWAVDNGNLDMLMWLRENDCPYDESACERAAYKGNLDLLIWLRQNDYPWNERTFEMAGINGDLNILKWLKENDCPWNEETLKAVIRNKHQNIISWVKEKMNVIDNQNI